MDKLESLINPIMEEHGLVPYNTQFPPNIDCQVFVYEGIGSYTTKKRSFISLAISGMEILQNPDPKDLVTYRARTAIQTYLNFLGELINADLRVSPLTP